MAAAAAAAVCVQPVVSSEPDLYVRELGSDAGFLLLASDGVWDVLDTGSAARLAHALLLETKSANATAQYIVRYAASERGMLGIEGNGKARMGESGSEQDPGRQAGRRVRL